MLSSIIWAEQDNRIAFDDYSFVEALDIKNLININRGKKIGEKENELCEFFSVCPDTLELRQELFEELLNDKTLFEKLDSSFESLANIYALQNQKDTAENNEKLLYSVREIEAYVEYLTKMKDIFHSVNVKSKALKVLWELLKPLCEGDDFDTLCKAVEKQSHEIKNIKSITVGVNLDSQLRPSEAGVLTINEQSFVSGDYLNKLLRLDFGNDNFYCPAPLLPLNHKLTNEEFYIIRTSINSAMNKVLSSSLKSWSGIIKKHIINNLRHLSNILYEWTFVSVCTKVLYELTELGFAVCKPGLADSDEVIGLYHPVLAMSALSKNDVVKNALCFDKQHSIYILTGPNQGGKSIYTQSVGIMYAMLHLGLLLPANKAVLRLVDNIFVHFVDIRKRSYVHGRLSDECNKIQSINKFITKDSLFLFDEALSSTNAAEAVAISTEIITAYLEIGSKGIFATHFHELCDLSEEYEGIDNLTAQIDEDSHKRIFKIVRGNGGKSYASDIAQAFGLTKDEIVKNAKAARTAENA